ncbi:MAG: AMP-binding protein, partial [Planctomycetes bacterium]|nr:AMP-binding protein [Planctomycetota bacterium]
IYSSGAPLSTSASLQVDELFAVSVTEVYGSSETGGIAWRQQSRSAHQLWSPLHGVEVRQSSTDECLELRSSHLAVAETWYRTSDCVDIKENGDFTLRGRTDRIVKIEGKRCSLDDMEQFLQQHPAIESAVLVVMETQRVEIAACVIPSKEGWGLLEKQRKLECNKLFKTHLLQKFERAIVPRRWRYQAQLPVNSQGKIQYQEIKDIFAEDSEELGKLPEVQTYIEDGQSIQVSLHMPRNLIYFIGHFSKAAVLPGVVQIHWAQYYAQKYFSISGKFLRLEAIKFQRIIQAEQDIQLHLQFIEEKNKLLFHYESDQVRYSSGRIVYSEVEVDIDIEVEIDD